MTSYYTLMNTRMLATLEEMDWLKEQIATIDLLDGDALTEYTPAPEGVHPCIWAAALDARINEEPFPRCEVEYRTEEPATIGFLSDETVNIEDVVALVQAILQRYRPEGYVTLRWADTASRSVPGAYSGGWAQVSVEGVTYSPPPPAPEGLKDLTY